MYGFPKVTVTSRTDRKRVGEEDVLPTDRTETVQQNPLTQKEVHPVMDTHRQRPLYRPRSLLGRREEVHRLYGVMSFPYNLG